MISSLNVTATDVAVVQDAVVVVEVAAAVEPENPQSQYCLIDKDFENSGVFLNVLEYLRH